MSLRRTIGISSFGISSFACLTAMSLAATPALASPAQSSAPGALVTACGGIGWGTMDHGGGDIEAVLFQSDTTCNAQTMGAGPGTISSSVNTSGSSNNNAWSAGASGSVSYGALHLNATSVGSSQVHFPTAAAQGGWTDKITMNGTPAQAGTAGTLVFSVDVHGTLTSLGHQGLPGFLVTPYLNGQLVNPNALFSAANPHPVIGSLESLGYQSRVWFGDPALPTLNVNETVLFNVPFIYGTPFSLGLYAIAFGSNSSFGNDDTVNTAESAFNDTVTWEGIDEVLAGDTPITDFTIDSQSGTDWKKPFVGTVPEPASLALFGVGMVGLLRLRRRRA